MKVAELQTVIKDGDGTNHHAFIIISEDGNMKLKCNLCLLERGVAVKTEELVIRNVDGRDLLVCETHKERIDGDKSHEGRADIHN